MTKSEIKCSSLETLQFLCFYALRKKNTCVFIYIYTYIYATRTHKKKITSERKEKGEGEEKEKNVGTNI